MSIDLRNIIEKKIEEFDARIYGMKSELQGLCVERQEIAALRKALSSHGLNDGDVNADMKAINIRIIDLENHITFLQKELDALNHYFRQLGDSQFLKSEEEDIANKFPFRRIS